jgi:hypothetical protein
MAPEISLSDGFDFKVMFFVLTGLGLPQPVRSSAARGEGRAPEMPGSLGAGCTPVTRSRRLIEACRAASPLQRPWFEEIVFRLGEEAGLEAVKKYQARVCPPALVQPAPIAFADRAR